MVRKRYFMDIKSIIVISGGKEVEDCCFEVHLAECVDCFVA